jgi:hypothetical protein
MVRMVGYEGLRRDKLPHGVAAIHGHVFELVFELFIVELGEVVEIAFWRHCEGVLVFTLSGLGWRSTYAGDILAR